MTTPLDLTAQIAEICAQHGLIHVVISPGSRSAPLTVAFARHPRLRVHMMVDERAAAFIALGLAQQTQRPVALVCTSGTAPLNYGPAVTEAYYQQLPLILLTADRPPEWLDQQDNQTSHQRNLFAGHVQASYELPVDYSHPDALWYAERLMSEALNRARWPIPGPVHINIPLREPLYTPPRHDLPSPKVIQLAPVESHLTEAIWQRLLTEWYDAPKRLVVAGLNPPDKALAQALSQLAAPVMADITANLSDATVTHADMLLPTATRELAPDLLITFGGPVTSKHLKNFLRKHRPRAHWHIQPSGLSPDTFQCLTRVIPVQPTYFFHELAQRQASITANNAYLQSWRALENEAKITLDTFLSQAEFSEFTAMDHLLHTLPADSRLQLGNSMPIRYANLIGLPHFAGAINANRGTSGIDGTLSTAVGAALATEQITTLITGDLAFFYDRNGLWLSPVPPNLRVIILNNNGGGIFRLIDGPGQLSEAEITTYFTTPHTLTARHVAADHACRYFFCEDSASLLATLPDFFAPHAQAAILEIKTDMTINGAVFEQFKRLRS